MSIIVRFYKACIERERLKQTNKNYNTNEGKTRNV